MSRWRRASATRSGKSRSGRIVPVASRCTAWRTSQKLPSMPRAITTPSTIPDSIRRARVSTSSTSPLPKTGRSTASLTRAIAAQSAVPSYFWHRVRPWTVTAAAPASARARASSGALIEEESQPRRIFTVTGTGTAATIAATTRAVACTSRASAAPLPRLTTLETGQPRLTSTSTAPRSTQTTAASAITAGSQPTSCAATGDTWSGKSSRWSAASVLRTTASAATISVETRPAPNSRQIARHGASVIPTIGATRTGDESSRPPISRGRSAVAARAMAPWYGEGRLASAILVVDETKPVERESLVDNVDRGDQLCERRRESTGGDHLRPALHLLTVAPHQTFDEADVAEDDARLHAGRGRVADRLSGSDELDPDEHRGMADQRVVAELDTGRDRSSQIVPLRIDCIEGRGRAEVHQDAGTAVEVMGGNRVGDPVGPDPARVVVLDADAGQGAGP